MSSSPELILLGPQQPEPCLHDVVAALPEGDAAVITAGWQEREVEDEELSEIAGRRCRNLRLYARAREAWAEDSEFHAGYRDLQDRLMQLRRAYNVRLSRAMQAWADLAREKLEPRVVEPERAAALETVRQIDAQHLARIAEFRAEYDERFRPDERPAIARRREEIESELAGVAFVAISGGHVAVLLNRMRLWGADRWLPGHTVVAWSAGAMALASRVVLFHDSPPQGPGNAEAFDAGLGLYDDVVALPHGSARLDIADVARVGRFSQRFAPARCVLLDPGSRLRRRDGAWSSPDGVTILAADGSTQGRNTW